MGVYRANEPHGAYEIGDLPGTGVLDAASQSAADFGGHGEIELRLHRHELVQAHQLVDDVEWLYAKSVRETLHGHGIRHWDRLWCIHFG